MNPARASPANNTSRQHYETQETPHRPRRSQRLNSAAQSTVISQPHPTMRSQRPARRSRRPHGQQRPPAWRTETTAQPLHNSCRPLFQRVRLHGQYGKAKDGHVHRHGRVP